MLLRFGDVATLGMAMISLTNSNLATVLAGWAFTSRRTVTGMLLAAGAVGRKHHSALTDRPGPRIGLDRIGCKPRPARDVEKGVLILQDPFLQTG